MSKKIKTETKRTSLFTLMASAALATSLAASPAMAFVDKTHSAEGVSSSSTMYKGTSKQSGGFVDHYHTAAAKPSSAKIEGHIKAGTCGFIDCDHSAG